MSYFTPPILVQSQKHVHNDKKDDRLFTSRLFRCCQRLTCTCRPHILCRAGSIPPRKASYQARTWTVGQHRPHSPRILAAGRLWEQVSPALEVSYSLCPYRPENSSRSNFAECAVGLLHYDRHLMHWDIPAFIKHCTGFELVAHIARAPAHVTRQSGSNEGPTPALASPTLLTTGLACFGSLIAISPFKLVKWSSRSGYDSELRLEPSHRTFRILNECRKSA
jgi:hypothetical protein